MATLTATATCPGCGAPLPDTGPWPRWCPECDWNVEAPEQWDGRGPRSRLEREYLRLGARAGERLTERLARAADLRPRLTPAKLAAIAIAVATHLFTLALAAAGVRMLAAAPGNPAILPFAAFVLGCVWLMRPRLGRPPREDIVAREQAPELHRLAGEVATALGTGPPDCIVVDDHFNAAWGVVGLRRRRVLWLGLPLIDLLDAGGRVAIIAHELAHARNGDVRRGLVVGSSVHALDRLYGVLAPDGVGEDAESGTFGLILHGVLWLVSRPVAWLLVLQAHLLFADSRRAEFLADALAARVAGTAAELSVDEMLLQRPTVDVAERRVLHGGGDLFAVTRAAVAAVPPLERERRRRAARLESSRLAATHPPTGQRMDLVRRRPAERGIVFLNGAGNARIDAELEPLRAPIASRVLDRGSARLHGLAPARG